MHFRERSSSACNTRNGVNSVDSALAPRVSWVYIHHYATNFLKFPGSTRVIRPLTFVGVSVQTAQRLGCSGCRVRRNVVKSPKSTARGFLPVKKLADLASPTPDALAMQEPTLYSIQEARRLLGGISRNTIYQLLRTGQLASVVIGCRRFISRAAIDELIAKSTTTVSPSRASTRSHVTGQATLPLSLPFPRRGRPLRAQS